MHEGTMDEGAWSCGMVAGLVNDIPTVQELIDSIMSQADEIINNRLQKL
jgi:nitronate monooxygenase